jgi:hypothetical protein
MGKRKWSRQSVIAKLRELESNGEAISPKKLAHGYSGLYSSGRRLFGGSSEMYQAAGISVDSIKGRPSSYGIKARVKWTRESVIAKLRELQSSGEDISPQKLFEKHGGMYYSGMKIFGGSRAMYQAAGISLNVFKRAESNYWTKERILAELKSIYQSGEDMSYSSMAQHHSSLYHSSRLRFGRYSEALKAADIQYEKFQRRHALWTDEDVVSGIQRLWLEKVYLSPSNIQKNEPSLYVAAVRRFGGWFDALSAAGVPAEKFRKLPARKKRSHMQSWTDARVIHEIKRLAEKGEDLSHSIILKKYPALEGAARSRFGNSWHKALDAAGVDEGRFRKMKPPGYWTKARVITELQIMYANKADLRNIAVRENRSDLLTPAEKLFGGYYPALEAAGIPIEDYRRYRPEGYWSKPRVVEELQRLHSLGVDLAYASMEEYNNALVHGATRAFGKYEKAFAPAGLDYEEVRKDKMMESFIGRVFEKYLEEMMRELGWKVRPQQRFKVGREVVRPDFVDSETGMWIDAKVDSWSPGVAATILKYSEFCDRILVIYLKGKKRKWISDDADIRPVSDYFPALIETGREDLIRDFEKLKKGIVRPELQSELERFSKGFH